MIWFTADTHFQHKGKSVEEGGSGGIIRMAKRPFETIEEHDAGLKATGHYDLMTRRHPDDAGAAATE